MSTDPKQPVTVRPMIQNFRKDFVVVEGFGEQHATRFEIDFGKSNVVATSFDEAVGAVAEILQANQGARLVDASNAFSEAVDAHMSQSQEMEQPQMAMM